MNYSVLISGVIVSLLANYLLWGIWTGICFPIFMGFAVAATVWNARRSGKGLDESQGVLAVLSVIFSGFVALRGAAGLTLANASIAIYFWTLLAHSISSGRSLWTFGPEDYFFLPRRFSVLSLQAGSRELGAGANRMTGVAQLGEKERDVRNGLLIAIPVLVIFLVLMVFADDSFQSFVTQTCSRIADLFHEIHLWTLLGRLVFFWFVGALVTGAFLLFRTPPECPQADRVESDGLSFWSGIVVMGLVNALFAAFALFQVKFMLAQSQGALAGITNRQNFYLMMTIGLLAFLGSCALEGRMQRQSESQRKAYLVNVLLAAFLSFIVMLSAYYRFTLYENAWGFTIRRFYAHSFVPYIALFYLLLVGKILKGWSRARFLNGAMLLTAGLFIVWNSMDPHAFVARRNVELLQKAGDVVPPVYLESLSYDAVPVFVAYIEATRNVDINHNRFLLNQRLRVRPESMTTWREAHWARIRAVRADARFIAIPNRPYPPAPSPYRSNNITSWPELLFCIAVGLLIVVFIVRVVV